MGAFAKEREGFGEGEGSEEEAVMANERRVERSQSPPSGTSAQDSSGNTTDGDEASLDAYPPHRSHGVSAGVKGEREEGVAGCSIDGHPSYRSDRSGGLRAEREGGGAGCLNCDEAGAVDRDGFTTTTSSTRRRHIFNGNNARSAVDVLIRGDGVKKMQPEDGGKVGMDGKHGEKAPAAAAAGGVRFFCKPNSSTLFDVLIVFMCHLFPFSVFAAVSEILLLKWAVAKYGSIVMTIFFSFSLLLISIPGYYSPSVRKVLRCLYVPLARYMKSMAFIVSSDASVSSSSPSVSSSSTSANESSNPKFDDKRSIIFAIHPHGRVFYTPTMLAQLHEVWHESAMGRKNDLFIGASSGFFFVPILRNLLYAVGVIPVSKSSVVRKLRTGNDVIIVVGGIKEVSLGTSDYEDVLYLARRKGFIKLAIEENVGVVPVYCFNENSLFKHDPKWFLTFWEKVNRLIVIGVPLFRGVWNTPMPYRRNILVAFGEPMFAKEGESTDAFHSRYMQELKNLYHKHVALSGRPDHKLVIV